MTHSSKHCSISLRDKHSYTQTNLFLSFPSAVQTLLFLIELKAAPADHSRSANGTEVHTRTYNFIFSGSNTSGTKMYLSKNLIMYSHAYNSL